MTSNQQNLQTNQFDIENLKDLALSYMPPSGLDSLVQDRELKHNESELVSSRFESLSKRFCQCDLLHIDQSSKSTWTEQAQNNPLFDQRYQNQLMQNYSEWNVNNWNERYITPYGDFMPGTLGDCQMYNTNVQGFFGQHCFMTPQSARNGFMPAQFNESSDNLELIRSRKKRNKMSFTMKKIVSNNPCLSGMDDEFKLSNSSNTNGQDENISSFACRADVIYKKILRDFRRYFINDFKEKTGYRESKSESPASNTYQLLESYSDTIFGEALSFRDDIIRTLGTLIFSNYSFGTNNEIRPRTKKEVNKIHDTLYKFSITKVDKLLEDRSVGFLLKYFISDDDNTRSLIESSKITEKSYQTAFDLIEKRVDAALSASPSPLKSHITLC